MWMIVWPEKEKSTVKWFWAQAEKRFKVKKWGFAEEEQPQMVCSKLIQKQVDAAGVP